MRESFEAGPARGQYYVPYEASAEGFGSSYSEKGSALQEVLAPFKLKVTGPNNEIVSEGVATLQATQIEGKGSQETLLTLKAPQVHVLSDKSTETSVDVKQKGPVFEKTITQQEVAHSNEIQGLTLRIEADHLEGVEPTLKQAVLDIQASLTKLISQEEFASTLKTLVHKQVVGSAIDPGLAMVVGLAAGLATFGAGLQVAALAGFIEGTVEASMIAAAVSSSCSQMATSLVASGGDPRQVLKDMTSSSSLKSLAISVASAGLMHELKDVLNLPTHPKGFEQHLKVNAVRSVVSSSLNMTIGGMKPEDALLSAARMIVAGTLGGLGANEIAQLYSDGELDYLMHKIGHAFLGGGMGAILSDDVEKGLWSGGIGGFFGEIAGEELVKSLGDKPLTTVLGEMDETVMKAQLAAAVVTALMGQDVGIATFTAENAIRNNSLIVRALELAKVLAQGASKEGTKQIIKKGAEKATKVATKEAKKVAKLADKVAEKTGGIKTSAKGEGYIIRIPNGKQDITVRIMEKGGKRLTSYYRVSINEKGSITKAGEISSNRGLTHLELHKNSIDDIINIISKLKK